MLRIGVIRILSQRQDKKILIENQSCFICKFGDLCILLSAGFMVLFSWIGLDLLWCSLCFSYVLTFLQMP